MNDTLTARRDKTPRTRAIEQPEELDIPPHDLETERCVLGCLLLVNDSLVEVSPIVDADCFYYDPHRRIFKAFTEMFESQGGGIDAVTLRDELTRRGELEEVGGVIYILQLLETVPQAEHAAHYAKIVRAKSDQRRAIAISKQTSHELQQPGADTSAIIARMSEQWQALGESGKAGRTFAGLTYGELLAKDIPPVEWLVEGVLVTQETCAVIAPSKALKTTILIDLAVSLATATLFMNRFEVPVKRRVMLLLGETPEASARLMLNRACEVRGIDPQDISDSVRIHCGGLPSVASDGDLQILKRNVSEFGADVTILDPLYLASSGLEMSQLNQVGPCIRAIGDACKPGTLLIAHHATKSESRNTGTTLRLESGSGAGIAESVGQWFILNREAEFDPESDEWHSLNAAYGGRGGHGGRLSIRFKESTGEFDVSPLGSREDARQEEREAREQARRTEDDRQLKEAKAAITRACRNTKHPQSKQIIETHAGVQQKYFRRALAEMCQDQSLIEALYRDTRNRSQKGWMLREYADDYARQLSPTGGGM